MKKQAVHAFILGAFVWVFFTLSGDAREAWDGGAYWLLGVPALLIGAFLLGWQAGKGAWKLGLWMAAGQGAAIFLCGLLMGGDFNLLPLTLIVIALFGVPCVIAAKVGGWMGR